MDDKDFLPDDLYAEDALKDNELDESRPPVEIMASVRNFFNGNLTVKAIFLSRLPFIAFLIFVILIYIGNGYHARSVSRDIDRMTKEVKELRTKSLMLTKEYMFISRQTEIIKEIQKKHINLEIPVEPPIVIK